MTSRQWLLIGAFAAVCLAIGMAILAAGYWFFLRQPPGEVEGRMEMTLPGGGTYRARHDDDPSEPPAESSVVIVVQSTRGEGGGQVAGVSVRTPQGRKEIPADQWRSELVAELKKARAASGEATPSIRIEADKRLKWASIVEIMDAGKQAGFNNVGFAPSSDD